VKQGVVVAMATHNSERLIERALSSINATFNDSGRQYALVIADDASSDSTLTKARRFQSTAAYRSTLGFTKASCVGESKNRASMMTLPFLEQFPWVLWMDDDDEMLPGRLQLIDKMESHGQKAAVGDWIHSFDGGSRREFITGDWSIANRCFSPCMTAIHGSLIPKNGKYFHHAPTDIYEDLATHSLMTLGGVHWCYHGGFNIHTYHRRDDSWSGIGDRSRAILNRSVEYMAGFRKTTNIKSFCTVAIGSHAISELRLMVKTLRLHNNRQPLTILTDPAGAIEIADLNLADDGGGDVHIIVEYELDKKAAMFPEWSTKYQAANLAPAAMISKMKVIQNAINSFGNTLFIDSDQIFLREINEQVSSNVGMVHEGPNTMSWPMRESDWSIQFLGAYNGGMVFFDRSASDHVSWWADNYVKSYLWCGDDSKPHGGFNDQSSLEMIAATTPVHAFHRGYGVSIYRMERGIWPEVKAGNITFHNATSIVGGHDLFYQGWPMMTIHQHFRNQFWYTDGREVFTNALSMSSNQKHTQTLGWIRDGMPAEDQVLSRRRRVRYIDSKVAA
jgi:glycosyltransferase involved in cell wall biosynthesis